MIKVDRKLPATETYACSKGEARGALAAIESLNPEVIEVHFGATTHFEFDDACHPRPTLKGTVVAAARVPREGIASVNFFPLKRADFSEREHKLFVETQLPEILAWVGRERNRTAAEILGHRELIIQSLVDGFTQADVTFG